ncbi:MAG: acyltransferase [Syntrophales bacterium]|nr:acyltransferase [Syntrophales bacterium]
MLSFLPSTMLGATCILLVVINTIVWTVPVHIFAMTKLLIPHKGFQARNSRWVMAMVRGWLWGILFSLKLTQNIKWDIKGLEGLRSDEWYFVNSNHQSWTDIVVLLRTFGNRIAFPKFFLKKELAWIPILGSAWWALDYPFMKRYSKKQLEKHPELRGKDLETTRKMCERYIHTPVSILNFIEGTRFTAEKHEKQNSPYRHLLNPKAGGLAFALGAMNGKIRKLLDVTILYPDGPINFWNFLCGRVSRVVVRVEEHLVPEEFLRGDYMNDSAFRNRFQAWVRALWKKKDDLIEGLVSEYITSGGQF